MKNCYITTTETFTKKYPLEFLELSQQEQAEAMAEYDYIEKVEKELSEIDSIVDIHNSTVKALINVKEDQKSVSYTLKRCMPEINMPHVNETYDLIR